MISGHSTSRSVPVAQLAERLTHNRVVAGSSPAGNSVTITK